MNDNVSLSASFYNYITIINNLCNEFIDRNEEIMIIASGFISKTNVLLIGDPGTAKSMIIKRFAQELGYTRDNGYFDYLLTKFTEPSEIFGPANFKSLKEGSLIYESKNKLQDANIVFLDEVFNANSSILNALLMVINEKRFILGDTNKDVNQLLAVFGASNHTPDDPDLKAFFDRFPVRIYFKSLEKSKYKELVKRALEIEKKGEDLQAKKLKDKKDDYSKNQEEKIITDINKKIIDDPLSYIINFEIEKKDDDLKTEKSGVNNDDNQEEATEKSNDKNDVHSKKQEEKEKSITEINKKIIDDLLSYIIKFEIVKKGEDLKTEKSGVKNDDSIKKQEETTVKKEVNIDNSIKKKEETKEFITMINKRIIDDSLSYIQDSENLKDLEKTIFGVQDSKSIFISDRSMKPLIKMVVAHAMIRCGVNSIREKKEIKDIKYTIELEDLKQILKTTWEKDEEQYNELNQMCEIIKN